MERLLGWRQPKLLPRVHRLLADFTEPLPFPRGPSTWL
jgi:hypothetical protein